MTGANARRASRGQEPAGGAKKNTAVADGVKLSSEATAKGKAADGKTGVNFDAWGDTDKNTKEAQAKDGKTAEQAKANEDLAAALGDRSLRNGMHSESVRSLQSALNDKLGKELATDGKFGPKTKAAVKEFQRQNGLAADGIVGPQTKAALTGMSGEKSADKNKPGQPTKDKVAPGKPGEMSFGKKLSDTQKKAVNQMVADLKAKGFDVKADDIVNFMAVETGGTFSPSIRAGGKKSGAVGLAQFTGIAIKDMNRFRGAGNKLSKSKLSKMSFTEQSKVVTEYLSTALGRKRMQGRNISASDLYTAVFAPAAIGRSQGSTIYSSSRNGRAYRANRSLDTNRDGKITKAELTARLNAWVSRGNALRG